jgi:DNA-binding CsgD family transcriptional regulator
MGSSRRSGGRLGFIEVGSDGEIRTMTSSAVKLLHKFFSLSQTQKIKLPPPFRKWIGRVQGGPEVHHHTLLVRKNGSRLRAHCMDHSGDGLIVMLWEEAFALPGLMSSMALFGLTSREMEIMECLMLGKTDSEISTLLHISIRTVQKHMENIFVKLGAENRIAAVSLLSGIGIKNCCK